MGAHRFSTTPFTLLSGYRFAKPEMVASTEWAAPRTFTASTTGVAVVTATR